MTIDVVIPSIGRPSLETLLAALGRSDGPAPNCTFVVDDRPDGAAPLDEERLASLVDHPLRVLRSGGAGPAAARNVGWRASDAEWIAFLDDDVVPDDDWRDWLEQDLVTAPATVAGVQGVVRVPRPSRALTDWERHVSGLESARWITADMAYRRTALEAVDGFDQQFPRAYREDADMALRVQSADWKLTSGRRRVRHPVGPTTYFASVRRQLGNADDYRMLRKHGRQWRARAQVAPGRRRRHALICGTALGSLIALGSGRRRWSRVLALVWVGGTAELAWARIAPGPRTAREVATMVTTSVVLPFAAVGAWLYGVVRTHVPSLFRER